jgi:hypothetical protein
MSKTRCSCKEGKLLFAGRRCLFVCDDLKEADRNPTCSFYAVHKLIETFKSVRSCLLISSRNHTIGQCMPRQRHVVFALRAPERSDAIGILCSHAELSEDVL